MYIELADISHQFKHNGRILKVLDRVSLQVNKGEFVCLLGPSGCGKTTLLNMLAGFEKPSQGSIRINGVQVTCPSPRYVTIFQNYGLLPWRTVQKNVELGLEGQELGGHKVSANERRERAEHFIHMVGLDDFRHSHPWQLSGGMQQRVAIARALAVDPDILFMDEPLGSLDALSRLNMQEEILRIWQQQRTTVIFVTHDIEEAVFLAQRIVVMTPAPGTIGCLIDVPAEQGHDRTSPAFLQVRDEVFAACGMKHAIP